MNKTIILCAKTPSGKPVTHWKVDVRIDSDCMFYCYPPEEFREFLSHPQNRPPGLLHLTTRKKLHCYGAESLSALEQSLNEVADVVGRAEETVSHVIRFTIRSTARYAKNAAGEIAPDARVKGFRWPDFMEHQPSISPKLMALEVGARAFKKTVTKLGEYETVEYDSWYGTSPEGKEYSHWEEDHPAAAMNRWSPSCRERAYENEVEYSPEIAEWFSSVMRRFALLADQLSSRFQEGGLWALMESTNLLDAPENE